MKHFDPPKNGMPPERKFWTLPKLGVLGLDSIRKTIFPGGTWSENDREAPTFLENFAKNFQISGQNGLKFQNQGLK